MNEYEGNTIFRGGFAMNWGGWDRKQSKPQPCKVKVVVHFLAQWNAEHRKTSKGVFIFCSWSNMKQKVAFPPYQHNRISMSFCSNASI